MPLTAEARQEIFNMIKSALEKLSPPMLISKNTDSVYEISGNKPVPYGSTKKIVPGMYYASVIARGNMVSFHFFPIYCAQPEFADLIPSLKKYMTGKSCFNFKKAEQVNQKELNALLKKGAQVWKKMGYMK